MRSPAWPAVTSALVAGVAFACQVVVDGDIESFACSEEGRVGPPACPTDLTCRGGSCVAAVAAPALGDPCDAGQACAAGDQCIEADILGGASDVCTRPCCTSGDCGEPGQGFVCVAAAGGGAAFCGRAGEQGLAAPGSALAGESCKDATDCRSGRCEEDHCIDTCCSDTNCASADAVCRIGEEAWECGASAGARPYLEVCLTDEDCASGLCVPMGVELRCSRPCCESAVCGTTTLDATTTPIACREIAHGSSVVRACSTPLSSIATGLVGVDCASGETCRSGLCGEAGVCTDVCCADADCGDPQAFACLPVPGDVAGTWVLRCAPK